MRICLDKETTLVENGWGATTRKWKIQDFEVSERRLRRFCRFLASNKAISFETLEPQLNQLQCKSSRGLVSPVGVAAVENLGLILLKTRSTMVLSSEEEVVQVLADWRKKTDRVFNDSGWEVVSSGGNQ